MLVFEKEVSIKVKEDNIAYKDWCNDGWDDRWALDGWDDKGT